MGNCCRIIAVAVFHRNLSGRWNRWGREGRWRLTEVVRPHAVVIRLDGQIVLGELLDLLHENIIVGKLHVRHQQRVRFMEIRSSFENGIRVGGDRRPAVRGDVLGRVEVIDRKRRWFLQTRHVEEDLLYHYKAVLESDTVEVLVVEAGCVRNSGLGQGCLDMSPDGWVVEVESGEVGLRARHGGPV